MGKKRGGRRGKASDAPENEPAKSDVKPGTKPQTKQEPQTKKETPTAKVETPELTPPPPSVWTKGPPQVTPSTSQVQQGGKPVSELSQSAWGRGRPVSTPSTSYAHQEPPYLGRGNKPQGTAAPRPGPPSEESWGGARPKEVSGRGRSRPGAVSGQSWVGARPREISGRRPELVPEQNWGATTKETPQITREPEKLSVSEIGENLAFKPGTVGRKIRVETNHVRLNLGDLEEVYRYDVTMQPEKKPKRMFKSAMELFREAYFPQNYPAYDGQKLLYSAKRLPQDVLTGKVTVQMDEKDTLEFTVTVKLTGTLNLAPLRNLLQKKKFSHELVQCVEIVFRQAYTNLFVGRRFFIPPSGNEYLLGAGGQMYLGGYQAVVKGWLPFFNVDVAHKAYTTSISIIKLITEICKIRQDQDLKTYSLGGWQIDEVNEYLKGLKVIYEVPNNPSTKRNYRVNGLAKSAASEKFKHEDQEISVEEFYRIKYRRNLQYPKLPTLWVGNKDRRICIALEYCTLQPGQSLDNSKMTSYQTSQMIKYSATDTKERKKKIQDIMKKTGHNENPCVRDFGFSISDQFEALDARVLNPPQLIYFNQEAVTPQSGTWRAKKFQVGAQIQKWTIIGFGVPAERVSREVNDLAKKLLDYGSTSGMVFSKHQPIEYVRYDRDLYACLEKKQDFDLIIVIISNNKDSYYTVKQIAELRIGCLTQCIKSDTLINKMNETTVRNILLKINSKMNGINHVIQSVGFFTDKEPCMVMGADVTHPSPHARTIPSVVAVTASHDLYATSYNISVYLQDPRTEIIHNLENITLEKLKMYQDKSKKIPGRIYFFRDGVADGDFDKVRQLEIEGIKKGCNRFRKDYHPKITFVVVQKRHHTRFFPTNAQSCGDTRNYNVPTGTCVDTVITDPDEQNFYLLSHQSIRGVARPTRYYTLYDDNKLNNDDLQQLTFYLCHLFTRCNRSVSYPAPTYFAHLAADRAKGYLHKKNIDVDNLDQRMVAIKKNFAMKNPMFFS